MTVDSLERQLIPTDHYDHTRLESRRRFLRFLLRYIGFTLLAKIDRAEGLENVPAEGPAILIINHIAYVDPMIVMNVLSRNIVPLAKIEVYNYPLVGIFPRLWEVIPVRRDEVDRRAVKMVLEVLDSGEIVLVAPEGTRSPQLQRGKEGVAYLATRSGAPVVPVAIIGSEGFPALRFSSPWSGSGAYVRFGKSFVYRSEFQRAKLDKLRKLTDEAMYQLASLLPAERRGVYSDLSLATTDTIEWF